VSTEAKAKVDSIRNAIQNAGHDTSVCRAYLVWGEEVYLNNPDTALILWQKVHDLAEESLVSGQLNGEAGAFEKKYLFFLAEALNNTGYIYYIQGDIPNALEFYHKSLKIQEEMGQKSGLATSLNNIGLIYDAQGDIPKALEFHHKSLKIEEELGNKSGMASSLNNIALIYMNQGDIPKALEFYHKSLKAFEEMGDKSGIATSLNNIGAIYNNQEDIPKALEFCHKSLKMYKEVGDKSGIATSLNNIGTIYNAQGDIPKALEFHHKSLKIREEIGDKSGIANSFKNIGDIELLVGNLTNALELGQQGLEIAQEIGSPDLISYNSGLLNKVAKKQGNYQMALEMYELHILMRDSINNEETQKASIRQQTKYEFEKAQLVKDQQEKETARLQAEVTARRDNLQYSVILICLLAIGGLVAMLGKLSLPIKVAEGLIFFSFLILFEFILVLGDPYVDTWTGGAPGLKLLINASVAAFIFPLHAFFEAKLKGRLVKPALLAGLRKR